jgi:hypothetical protein
MTEARLQLIRRFAALSVIAENNEAKLVNGEDIDLNDHALIASTLVRLVSRLGINRQMRDVNSPSPLEYARRVARRGAELELEAEAED